MAGANLCHLYKITDVSTGVFYIGKHKGVVQNNYWGSGVRIMRHIKKYGKTNMRYNILVIGDQNYIYDVEKKYLTTEFIDSNPNCLNLCKGGIGGNLGGHAHNKGKKTPPEVRKKQSLAKIGKPSPRAGKKHSPETIQKLKAIKRRPLSQEAKEKISKFNIGKKYPLCQCPYCGKIGAITVMPRWHFDKCKYKEVLN